MKRMLVLFIAAAITTFAYTQDSLTVYPTNWWVGMKNPALQLMVHAAGIRNAQVVRLAYPGVKLISVKKAESPNYLFINLSIGPTAKPGVMQVVLRNGDTIRIFNYQLTARRKANGHAYAQGITSADFVYLLMPDRFSNGDTSNDHIAGMKDQSLNRDSIFLRHGGDLKGVINHLDYLQQLGVTALWMTPVLTNDMPDRTEHGYAFTDHYSIDPRYGGADAYKKLSDELHKRGMKLIQDAVYNHVGLYHTIINDLPAKDWLHQWPAYTQTSFKDQSIFDPHAAPSDAAITTDGWFTPQMPDLNQRNPELANFLIQHAIWSVETFGVDGWRIDTYIYNDLEFMNRCNKALFDEYPKMTMFGEAWVHGTANQAYFAQNNINVPFKSNLPGAIDFQMNFYGIMPALNEPFGWTNGVNKLYNTLSNDFLYKDASRNLVFLDNHDMTRFFSQVGEDMAKEKMGLMWLLTTRGIPQLYYGTEVLMKGVANPDGWVRLDFPGGWAGDKKNAFTGEGLSADEKQIQELVKNLANYRKNSSALKTGRLMQYLPNDGLYVYFRYDEKQTVMCVMNTATKPMLLNFQKFAERTAGFAVAKNILTGEKINTKDTVNIAAGTMWVLELVK